MKNLTFRRFVVPADKSIEDLARSFPQSSYCKMNLTTEHFGTTHPTHPIQGCFWNIETRLRMEFVQDGVDQLAIETGHKIRLGTPIEALAYKTQNHPCPKNDYWIILGKDWEGKVLGWGGYEGKPQFYLFTEVGAWSSGWEIFIVEDLPTT